MAGLSISTKRVQLDKANTSIVITMSLAAVIIAFSLVSARALLSQYSYQSKAIKEQEAALVIAEENVAASQQLVTSYQAFNSQPANIIGGSSAGAGERDGDNSKIILDALPGQYDFPAVISSVEKLLVKRGFNIESLSGTDDNAVQNGVSEAGQEPVAAATSGVAVEMPFGFSVDGSYQAMNELVLELERSIRPIAISNMELSGDESQLSLTVNAKTYYQPAKELTFTEKVIK